MARTPGIEPHRSARRFRPCWPDLQQRRLDRFRARAAHEDLPGRRCGADVLLDALPATAISSWSAPRRQMEAQDSPGGGDFPVFLHPQTHEEYALARCERKAGHGYRGFTVLSTPDITLEEDLLRRDFTVNAIARDASGDHIDPYGGIADLQARVLRHVSPAFCEDPVRILRAARFMARWQPLGFSIAEETMALMRQMVRDGEVDHLVPERVFQELSRALQEPAPSAFLRTLRQCGALARVLPEVDAVRRAQRAEYHDRYRFVPTLPDTPSVAPGIADPFCVLTYDWAKPLTPGARTARAHLAEPLDWNR